MIKLKGSKDRKVANDVNGAGTLPRMSNTFGLPAGDQHSCPGMTEVCGAVCYANKLETVYPSVRALLMHNWNAVKDATCDEIVPMLDELLTTFERQADKAGARKVYRIHWDGDFFSEAYTRAWIETIRRHPAVQFWAYTRAAVYAPMLAKADLPNLALYFSADRVNLATARAFKRTYGMRIAYLAETFADGQAVVREATGKPGAKCPEQLGRLPLISTEGSACVRCGLCVEGKADIVFSASKH